ncbi:MAG: hydroxymethylglutaryl-CoA lyase [Flavobacteriaceae bacterium]|nr:hydroxymethylglutaryl-CoA lyase [Flavobacteriaceae bacterium]
MSTIKIIECPRDAMQSIKEFIPTDYKLKYLQSLVDVGFDTIDIGSFVSSKVIPQLSDSAEVIDRINLTNNTKLLVIIANKRGALEACTHAKISYLGYPFSISENFQMRNTNKTIKESEKVLMDIQEVCLSHNKELVVYLSMGFGNPYGDPWSFEIVDKWISKLVDRGVKIISLSDTIGSADANSIGQLFQNISKKYKDIEFGLHLHTNPRSWYNKVEAAYEAGCRRFDGAIKGFGGCPMASDKLVGNMPTEKLISFITERNIASSVNLLRFESAFNNSLEIFNRYK